MCEIRGDSMVTNGVCTDAGGPNWIGPCLGAQDTDCYFREVFWMVDSSSDEKAFRRSYLYRSRSPLCVAKGQCTCTTPVWVGRQRSDPHDGLRQDRLHGWFASRTRHLLCQHPARSVFGTCPRLHIDIQWTALNLASHGC
jgi:hypothetical protein